MFGCHNKFKHFHGALLDQSYTLPSILEIHFSPNFNYYPKHQKVWQHIYKKNNLYFVDPTLRILFDANHFFLHLKHHGAFENGLNKFLGNLKRLYDLCLNINIESNINWYKLLKYAKKYEVTVWVYHYLRLGKKFFQLNIPNNIIKELKLNSPKLKLWFVKLLDFEKVLQDQRNLRVKLFARIFLNK